MTAENRITPRVPHAVHRALIRLRAGRRALARIEDQRPVVGAAAVLVGGGSMLALLGGASALLFDNLQELAAATGAAVSLGLASRHQVGSTRRLLASLAISMAGACCGMLAWDLSHGAGTALSTSGDLLFVASVAIGAAAIIPAIFGGLERALLLGVATDALILFLAGIAVVAAIWAGAEVTASNRTAAVGAVLLVTATGACVLALITRRIAPAGEGPWALLAGATILGASWLMWIGDPNAPSTVGSSDFMFSAGMLLIAYGGVTWNTRSSSSPAFDRVAPVLAAGLPVAAILGSLGITALTHGAAIVDLVGIATAAVIVTSVGRQVHLFALEAQAREAEQRASALLEAKNQQLTASAAEIEDLYNRAPVGYHSLDHDGLIVRMNDTELAWLGYERDEVVARRHFIELLQPESQAEFKIRFAEFASTGVARDVDYELSRADGTTLPVLLSATAMRDDSGRFVMSHSTLWDLTDRRRAEDAMRASEERFRTLFEQATDSIAVIGPDGLLIDANPALSALLGYTIPELHGFTLEDLVAAEARGDLEAAQARVLAGEAILVELPLQCKKGGHVVVEASAQIRADGNVQVLMRDLSARRAAEAEQRRLVSAVNQTTDDILLNDPEGVIQYVNPAFERSTGYASSELIGRTVASVLRSGERQPEFDAEMEAAFARGEPWEGNIVNRRRDGSLFEHHVTISPIRGAGGALIGSVHVGRDLTREHELEAQLRQAAKMEAVGQLAGGVAHDFNNILTAIRGYAELARRDLPVDSEATADIDQVVIAADHAAELTRQLLAFGRKTVLDSQILDPTSIVEAIVPMLRRLLGEHIEFTVRTASGVGNIRADPAQLEQVILNLVVNASDAMPQGGRLRIETANVELDASYVRSHPGSERGPHVLLAVSDTGTGMDKETMAHIFEPFFTTKPVGQGTGMGLATVFGIVKMSGGSIDVDSAPNRGTRFHLYFPRVGDAPAAEIPSPGEHGAPSGRETILLVEDDQSVRRFAQRCLSSLGYTIIEARSGEEAMALAAGPTPIDLLVSDVVMPGIQGPELRLRLQDLCPNLRTLLVSGYPQRNAFLTADRGARVSYLAKPYSRDSLARAVRTMLDAED